MANETLETYCGEIIDTIQNMDQDLAESYEHAPTSQATEDAFPLTLQAYKTGPGIVDFSVHIGHLPIEGAIHFGVLLDNNRARAVAEMVDDCRHFLDEIHHTPNQEATP